LTIETTVGFTGACWFGVCFACGGPVILWDAASGKRLREMHHGGSIDSSCDTFEQGGPFMGSTPLKFRITNTHASARSCAKMNSRHGCSRASDDHFHHPEFADQPPWSGSTPRTNRYAGPQAVKLGTGATQ